MKKNNAAALCSCARVMSVALTLPLLMATARAADPTPPATAAAGERVPVEVFHDVRILSGPSDLVYPQSEKDHDREGWVTLTTMISPKGKPYEASVVDSSGNAKLEQAALKALGEMDFQPARSGNTPVDSGFTFTIRFFAGGPALGASEHFITMYKRYLEAFNTADRADVDAALAQLQPRNLYEDAFRSYAQYNYDRRWGTELEQAKDLGHALTGEGNQHYLPEALYDDALVARFSLQVKHNDFGAALLTWKTLKPRAPAGKRTELQRVADQITAIRAGDRAIATAGVIDQRSWASRLFKNHFSITVRSGGVTEIKLRCKKKYLFFKFDPDLEYTVNPNAGDCDIEVLGDPGTTFNLTQS